MKVLITVSVFTLTLATLFAACNADKVANVIVKSRSTLAVMQANDCIDVDGTFLATDHCMGVLYPERGEF